jgi:hypothetical protein
MTKPGNAVASGFEYWSLRFLWNLELGIWNFETLVYCVPSNERKNMKTFLIAIAAALVSTASAQEFRAPIGPQKPVRAMPTPPPMLQRRPVEGVIPRAFSDSRNPLQMLNPWAPPRYGTWIESTAFAPGIPFNRTLNVFDPDYPGKWKGIKFFEILF